MQFLFQSLAWGFLLVLAPLLIHLINLMRHRRTRWAAMEFLLESYRKNRRWVWLKQAILLASRMAIMALLVAMLAQWVSGAKWLSLLGQSTTHHYILLDDSYSMGDMALGKSAYQKALAAVAGILRSAAEDRGLHQVTILRYSKAALVASADSESKADVAADVLGSSVPVDPMLLLERLNQTVPSAMDSSCESGLKMVQPLIQQNSIEQAIVYIVSDFRKKDWDRPDAIRATLQQLDNAKVKIELIDCMDAHHQNLSIVGVEPVQEVLAAGVPILVNVQVRNHGTTLARNVQVRLRTVAYGKANEPVSQRAYSGIESELPPMLLETIDPGETVSRRVQVLFPESGSQVVEAVLPDDCLATDNRGTCVLSLSQGERILLIEGNTTGQNAFYMDAALNPGASVKTGLITETKGPEFLRDSRSDELSSYASIFLLDVPRLERRAIEHLEDYIRQGGGVGIILGDQTLRVNLESINQEWYRDGEGFLPVQFMEARDLPVSTLEGTSDLLPQAHPIFQSLLSLSGSPLQMVRFSRYMAIEKGSNKSSPDTSSDKKTKVIAALRDGSPLMVDTAFGSGRVVIMLSSMDPRWTNWPQDPTFVVTIHKWVGYLGSFRLQESSGRVGQPITWNFPSREALPNYDVLLPASLGANARVQLSVNAVDDGQEGWQATLGKDLSGQTEDYVRAVLQPGVVEVWRTQLQGEKRVQNFARNPSPSEGDLTRMTSSDLAQSLRPVDIKYRTADSLGASSLAAGLANRNHLLMFLLLALLLFEQFFAWRTSYHMPSPTGGAA